MTTFEEAAMANDDVPPEIPAPYPSSATIRAIETSTIAHEALVTTQLQVLREKIVAVEREAGASREGLRALLMQRLDDIDRANVILAENVNRTPTLLQSAVATLKELQDVKFDAVDAQIEAVVTANRERFELLDRQTVREKAAADLALAAAFDAQKESAAATDASNKEAIRKSELGTAETIKTNAESQRQGQQSLSDKIDDLKDRLNQQGVQITTIQTARATTQESHHDQRGGISTFVGVMGSVLGLLALITTIVLAIILGS